MPTSTAHLATQARPLDRVPGGTVNSWTIDVPCAPVDEGSAGHVDETRGVGLMSTMLVSPPR